MKLSILASGSAIPDENENWKDDLPKPLKRRTPRIWQLSYAAAQKAMELCDEPPTAIVCATALGALNETITFLDNLDETGYGSPRQFIASVHNSMAGKLASELNITGPNLTLCDSHNSFASAIISAALLGEKRVLLVVVDEHLELLQKVYENCSNSDDFTSGPLEGAVAFVLTTEIVDNKPLLDATAPKPVSDRGDCEHGSYFKSASDIFHALKKETGLTSSSYSPTAKSSSRVTLSV